MSLPKRFDELPDELRLEAVRPYFEALSRRRGALALKRLADLVLSLLLLAALSPVMLLTAAAVALDSPGGVFYRQTRVTTLGRAFGILKFRSMVADADKQGPLVTVDGDARVTRVGRFIRRTHLDEFPQLINVLLGDMSFVGTRPEVPKYVAGYTDEMRATLLMPAGITSEASVRYKDEARLIAAAQDADRVYLEEVLPGKMAYNLDYLRGFSLWRDTEILCRTALLIFGD